MKTIRTICVVGVLLIGYCMASTSDWTQEVIQSMSEEEYDEAVAVLGDEASDYDIAKYYMEEMKP